MIPKTELHPTLASQTKLSLKTQVAYAVHALNTEIQLRSHLIERLQKFTGLRPHEKNDDRWPERKHSNWSVFDYVRAGRLREAHDLICAYGVSER